MSSLTQEMESAWRGGLRMQGTALQGISMMTRGTVELVKLIIKLRRDHVLNSGEAKNLISFMKATNDNYDITSIPMPHPSEETLEDWKKDYESFQKNHIFSKKSFEQFCYEKQADLIRPSLNEQGISYAIIPRVNKNDPNIKIAVYRNDAARFAAFFKDHIRGMLSGGELSEADLVNLTDGKYNIISVPITKADIDEETDTRISEDFKRLKINYARLPDLNFSDGRIQFLVANNDLERVKAWYEYYKESMLNAGKQLINNDDNDELQVYDSIEEYQTTGKTTAEEYTKGADEEYKVPDPPEKTGSAERSAPKIKSDETRVFEKYLKNPDYQLLSIDAKTLVKNEQNGKRIAGARDLTSYVTDKSALNFYCRVPGTYGAGTAVLGIDKNFVFYNEDRDRYYAFIDRSAKPMVTNVRGEDLPEFGTAKELLKCFDDAYKAAAAEEIITDLKDLIPNELANSVPIK